MIQGHVVIDAFPASGGVACRDDIEVALTVLSCTDSAGTGFVYITGFGADHLDIAIVLILDTAEEPVGEDLSFGMIRRGKRFISPGFEYLPAQVIVQGGFHDQGHIIDSTLMVFIVKAHTICKMGGIGKAKLLQLSFISSTKAS